MDSCVPDSTSTQDLNDSGNVQDTSASESGYKGQAQLLDLSDDVLLCILKLCSPRDLKALGYTCPRLGSLVCDHTLWQRVVGGKSPIGQQRFKWYLTHCLTDATRDIRITGYADSHGRCMGVHDPSEPLHSSIANSAGQCGGGAGARGGHIMDDILFRMWFPVRPSDAVSPRWLSKEERDQPWKLKAEGGSKNGRSTEASVNGGQSACSCEGQGTSRGKGKKVDEASGSSSSHDHMNVDEDCARAGGKVTCPGPQFTLTAKLLRDLKRTCTQLTTLFLEYCNIDYKYTNIGQFPASLEKLSLRGTRCYNQPELKSYLYKIMDHLPNLEYLDVSECAWFEPESLMPLSKAARLRELRMRRCPRLTECVAYASLATRYGFRQLRILDARGTPLADSEVSALGWLPLLEELYVSPPEDEAGAPEHAHSWHETLPPFQELEPWEMEEPEYYKVKIEGSEDEGFDDMLSEELRVPEALPTLGEGQLMEGPWRRRIIVVQPNANREMVVRSNIIQPFIPRRRPSSDRPDATPPKRPNLSKGHHSVRFREGNSLDQNLNEGGDQAGPSREDGTLDPEIIEGANQAGPSQEDMSLDANLNEGASQAVPSQSTTNTDKEDTSNTNASTSNLNRGEEPVNYVRFTRQNEDVSNLNTGNSSPGSYVRFIRKPSKDDPSSSGLDKDADKSTSADDSAENSDDSNDSDGNSQPSRGGPVSYVRISRNGPLPNMVSISRDLGAARADEDENNRSNNVNPSQPQRSPVNYVHFTRRSEPPPLRPLRPLTVGSYLNSGPNDDTDPPRGAPDSGPNVQVEFRRVSNEPPPLRPLPFHIRQIADIPPPLRLLDRLYVEPVNEANGPIRDLGQPEADPNAIDLRPMREINIENLVQHQECIGVRRQINGIPRPPRVISFQDLVRRQDRPGRHHLNIDDFLRHNRPDVNAGYAHHSRRHNLVTDAAVLRFGRGDNEQIVHIGRNLIHMGVEVANRPDRSNLRVLSVTGFRGITDRSLSHLSTAAPHLRRLDFSRTNVTECSVNAFKAIRPDCEVVFSKFSDTSP